MSPKLGLMSRYTHESSDREIGMFRIILTAAVALLALPFSLQAASEQDVIKRAFAVKFPQVEISNIDKTAVKGIYQVETSAGELLYVSSDSKFVFTGDLLNIGSGATVNESENWRSAKRVDALNNLQDKDLVVYPAKNEERGEVLVFTDSSCGYCRKFHAEISAMNTLGITVKYVAWPRYGLQSPAGQTMVNVWCSDDRKEAMNLAKNNQTVGAPAGKVCEQNTLQDQINLGHRIGVRGTPAVFSTDGRQLGGYLKASQLAQALGIAPAVAQQDPARQLGPVQ